MFGSKSTPDSTFQIILLSYGWPSSWALISFSFSHFTPNRGCLLLLRFSCYFFFFLVQKIWSLLSSGGNVLGFPLAERVAGRKQVHLFLAKRDVRAVGSSSGEVWCVSGAFNGKGAASALPAAVEVRTVVTPLSQTPMQTDPAFCAWVADFSRSSWVLAPFPPWGHLPFPAAASYFCEEQDQDDENHPGHLKPENK